MTGMLASVNSLEEALLIASSDATIIDLKQPAEGALGALPPATVRRIVKTVAGRKPVSATVGDLPMRSEIVYPAVAEMATTGVDYVKIGIFPGGDRFACIRALSALSTDHALIAVLFADEAPDFALLPILRESGFAGAMLDTMDKTRGSLTELMPMNHIERFILHTRQLGLISGLAGSLRIGDVPALLTLQPDYMGFRGALCDDHDRIARIDTDKVATLSRHFSPSGRQNSPLRAVGGC